MNLRRYRKDDPDFNVTALNVTNLIDVLLLLLIFFMITTTFTPPKSLKVELPRASAPPVAQQRHTVVITIDVQGRYFIDQRQVLNPGVEPLKRALQRAVAGRKDAHLVIRADARTPYQAVVTAMDAAGQLGLTRLSIATTQGPAGH